MDKNLETFLRLSDCYGVKMHRSAIVAGKTGGGGGGEGGGSFLLRMFYGICVPGFAKYGINCAEN